jgi:hypothetical protein
MVCLYVGLYLPPDHTSTAVTRIVSIENLLARRSFGGRSEIELKLAHYALTHGSSWDWDRDSGNRVSCFARILDALSPEPRLTNFRETAKERWYAASRAGNEFENYQQELGFYRSVRLRLEDSEVEVTLKPGDLLVMNNVTTVHGRIGRREPHELVQFLVGLRRARISHGESIRLWLVDQLSEHPNTT